ncbi:GNAT family N-acetyltransferase [Flavobacterium ranwuense]|uniref:GNAT family N-acetyltransferase n=1 Tax=Flavobacterium ranwuense TaxID=2541725 RepID=A0ABY2DTY9_9FLAO|nr:GNAT family N-acetyltransferase [Flavobacterium ranwuense]TDE29153.1 GNAT family N-acetyltransferase [Flavobacterium ranwuense]
MLNIYQLNTEEGIKQYQNGLSSLEVSEPHYLLDYLTVFSGGMQDLICFSFLSSTGQVIIMPGYLKPIVVNNKITDYFDFSTPYGYTGPVFSSGITQSDIKEFWETVDQWYLDNNVVTEFVRFNLSGNHISYSGQVFPTMLNVKGEIIDEDKQWTSFDHKVRKNVNRAKRESLSSKIFFNEIDDATILDFHSIYIKTMERTNAQEQFFYTLEQFKIFVNNNRNNVAICTIYFEEIPISAELLLVSDDTIFSFLGGTNELYFDKRPNDFLKVEALNWARNHNKKYYVLGGGYGFEDGIFKYKKSFFPNDVVKYYTGRKILNKDIYDELVEKMNIVRLATGQSELDSNDESFFPLYNKAN